MTAVRCRLTAETLLRVLVLAAKQHLGVGRAYLLVATLMRDVPEY